MAATDVFVCAGRRARTHVSLGRWFITSAATVASTYALDAVATVAGVLLVASGFLAGFGHGPTIAFLLATYVMWAAGLRVSLRANWRLLEQTGTSTNVVSKAAHDLVRLRTASVRARRAASAVGYVATEVAKEVPYYAGAFGAVFLTDSVSSNDAMIFLGGANLGAAGYEYGLAGVTRAFLGRRRPPTTFDTDWVPGDYLADYYSVVEPDEVETIEFFVASMRDAPPDEPVLFFGVGPTLHHVFLAAERASEIHLADYLPANLREIDRWLDGDAAAHDWRPFVRHTLTCEGLEAPTDQDVREREELSRARITRLLTADARDPQPLPGRYATVVSAYCADSATDDRATWETYMHHITGLVRPGGLFITAALRRSHGYVVGDRTFPSANVDEHDLAAVLAHDFEDVSITTRELPAHHSQGYEGIILATARRRSAAERPNVARPRG